MNAIPLSRARVLGPRVSDLIAALQMLDPDVRHSIEEVSVSQRFRPGGGGGCEVQFIGKDGDVFELVEKFRDERFEEEA